MGEPSNPQCAWFRVFWVSMFIFWDPKETSNNPRKSQIIAWTYCFWKSQTCKNQKVGKCKRRTPDIMKIRLKTSCKSWMWDEYLSKNMKLAFGTILDNASISFKKHKMEIKWYGGNIHQQTLNDFGILKRWDFETLEPRSQETLKPRN